MWWMAAACRPLEPAVAARAPDVAPAGLQRFVEGTVAVELGDSETAAKSARWMLLVDHSAWTAVHAAELLAAAGQPVGPALDALLDALDPMPPCEAVQVLDRASRVSDDPRITAARAARACP